MTKSYFASIPSDLPEVELKARRRRQRHAEWGLAVANMNGMPLTPTVLTNLQAYIDGVRSIEDLAQVDSDSQDLPSPAYLATLTRHRLEKQR